jgi:arsenical pump membrane protein
VLGGAVRQVWPAFLLVTGLLLVGLTASSDRLFLRAGALLERMPGPPAALLIAGMLLLACVTAVLNLDTAVVFLTPVLIAAAARRRVPVAPFLFSSIVIANASSLYLPGSNLTNLLVLSQHHISGGTFARQMFAPALVATLATCAGLLVLFRPELARVPPRPDSGRASSASPASGCCSRPPPSSSRCSPPGCSARPPDARLHPPRAGRRGEVSRLARRRRARASPGSRQGQPQWHRGR